jgi:CelD/BcsL family acetyltransferase involved in cellulose biosynthesis
MQLTPRPGSAEQPPTTCDGDRWWQIDTVSADAPLWNDWQDLTRSAPPIVAAEFFSLTARFLIAGEPLVVAVRSPRGLDAVLPLVRTGGVITGLRSDHSPRFDMVGDPDAVRSVWAALQADTRWRLLRLDGIPCESPLIHHLPTLAHRDGHHVVVQPTSRSRYFLLDGFEARLDSEFRRQLRRRAKRLDGLDYERVTTDDPSAFADLLALEGSGWKHEAGTSIASSARTVEFYRALTATFAHNRQLSLSFLRAHGKRIAVQLALEDDHTCYLLKTGYDPEHRSNGPGHLVIYHYALDARRRGRTAFELLGQDTDDKRKWTPLTRQRARLLIYRRNLTGTLEYALQHIVRPRVGPISRQMRRSARAFAAFLGREQ